MRYLVWLGCALAWVSAASGQELEQTPAEAIAGTPDITTDVAIDVIASESAVPVRDIEHSAISDETIHEVTPIDLPAGDAKSAVTPQRISLPGGEGSIEGLGESFTPDLSSGTGTYAIPIVLPAGRNGVQPSLSMSYGTSGGNGALGFGWSFGVPFIARQTDRGLPRYVDSPEWHPEEDRFAYNGGQELVPVDSGSAAALDGGVIPLELVGWQEYRARIEGAFMRFFRSPDLQRWIVQDRSGARFEFGVISDGPAEMVADSVHALQRDPESGSQRIFAWRLTRMSDAHGSTVYYRYLTDQGQHYLRDIHYASPMSCAAATPADRRRCIAPLSDYGHRVRFVYESRSDAFTSYVSTWAVTTAWRLRRVEVTTAEGMPGLRTLVRRYHMTYAPEASSFHSLLASVALEGRPQSPDPTTSVAIGDSTFAEAALGDALVGDLLPAVRFRYASVDATSSSVLGFGGIDATIHRAPNSPTHSLDEARTDLFDVNSDGLPDVIVTDPAAYRTSEGGPAVGVFFNGFGDGGYGPSRAGDFSHAIPVAVPSTLSHVMTLSNVNVTPLDIDGDGRSDLLHMPRSGNYGYFAVTRNADQNAVLPADQGWAFTHVPVTLPDGTTDPRIDFGRDSAFIESVDVDNDHLIDIVRTTGTEIQTWLNLGNYPGGDGRFGSARFLDGAWVLSTEPIATCVLRAGRAVDFEDVESRLADMNGDGIQDIVQLRRGSIVYWPGRGVGLWGDGPRACAASTTGTDRHITMLDAPEEINPELAGVELADVNGDGASDVVQVGFDRIDVWFNRAGRAFAGRITAALAPFAPAFLPRTRFADIDASGTVDIVYGNGGRYQWIDPMGGLRPRLLIEVDNGLGALTSIEYRSSAEDYLRDLSRALDTTHDVFRWQHVRGDCDARLLERADTCAYRSGGSPVVSTVVRALEVTDRLDALGAEPYVARTEYEYHDGYYEGIEQEFRGFGAADAISLGDVAHPTSIVRAYFHQGRRPNEIAADRLAENPYEALKGASYLSEAYDETGVYASTVHTTWNIRTLLHGLDGRAIAFSYSSRNDEVRYDTAPFSPIEATLTLDAVILEGPGGAGAHVDGQSDVRIRGDRYAHLLHTTEVVDDLGNALQGTAHGRIRGEFGEALPDERIVQRVVVERLADESGWLFASTRSWIEGPDGVALGETRRTYDPLTGDVSLTEGDASLAAPFEFEGDGAAAGFTQGDQTLMSSAIYDVWGSAIRVCAGGNIAVDEAACLRYAEVDFDTDYAAFALVERVATDLAAGAWTFLSVGATWDRGLGSPLTVEDANGHVRRATYDGFGRLTSTFAPPAVGCDGESIPTSRIFYALTPDPASQPLSTIRTVTELSCEAVGSATIESVSYVDGLERSRAVLATGDETHTWVRSGITRFTRRGTAAFAYQADLIDTVAPTLTEMMAVPETPTVGTVYDAFGRVRLGIAEDGAITATRYHALSTDRCDPNDLDVSSPHYGTCATSRSDGHGRAIDTIARNRQPLVAGTEYYRLWTDYRADGSIVRITRAETSSDTPRPAAESMLVDGRRIERTFVFDSAGRRVAATDPDADSRDPSASDANRSWRYLFNRVGDLVAVRDPRGCGQNFYYDRAGRLLGEAYVGCTEAQPSGELPVDDVPESAIALDMLGAATPVHVRLWFDELPWFATGDMSPPGSGGNLGLATGSSDRAMRTVVSYDDRGNGVWEARQIAIVPETAPIASTLTDPPGVPSADGVAAATARAFDEAHTYVLTASFDHAGRQTAIELPEDVDWTAMGSPGAPPAVGGALAYNRRGLPHSAALVVDGTAYPLVSEIGYTRDGLVSAIVYGDDAGGTRAPTTSTMLYDARRRPVFAQTLRAPGAPGTGIDEIAVLSAQRLHWDRADNLTWIEDLRTPEEWPAGHKPQSVRITHDALYRVTSADFEYALDGGGTSSEDDALDWRDARQEINADLRSHLDADPMRSRPAPMLPALPDNRVVSLTWEYDWLGNGVDWTDDAHAFYERSIGDSTSGDIGAGERPAALRLASNLPESQPTFDGAIDRGGYAELDYGVSGNVVAVTVHAGCRDASETDRCFDDRTASVETRRSALRDACACESEQHYRYLWDELNRLSEARRYDRGGSGVWELRVRQRSRYDESNERIVKHTLSSEPGDTAPPERIALAIYPGDFERRGVVADRFAETYAPDTVLGTESEYNVGGARIVWRGDPVGFDLDPDHRITFALTDLIGSTAAVIDLRSGAALEATTFYPNGARESWLAQNDVSLTPERSGFTGKEADEEVGLVYFGERYLMPHLGRWATPDPAQLHAVGGGEALNNYHYVAASLFQTRDPLGLAPDAETELLEQKGGEIWRRNASSYEPATYDPGSGPQTDVDHFVNKAKFREFDGWDRLTFEQKLEIYTDPGNLRRMSAEGNREMKGALDMDEMRSVYPQSITEEHVKEYEATEARLRRRVAFLAETNGGVDIHAANIAFLRKSYPNNALARRVIAANETAIAANRPAKNLRRRNGVTTPVPPRPRTKVPGTGFSAPGVDPTDLIDLINAAEDFDAGFIGPILVSPQRALEAYGTCDESNHCQALIPKPLTLDGSAGFAYTIVGSKRWQGPGVVPDCMACANQNFPSVPEPVVHEFIYNLRPIADPSAVSNDPS